MHAIRFTMEMLRTLKDKRLHGGESEAIAQSYEIGVRFVLTDDAECMKAIEQRFPEIRCPDTLVILSALDLQGYIPQWDRVVRSFFDIRPAGKRKETIPSRIRKVYRRAASLYDIHLDIRELSVKCSAGNIFGGPA